MDIRCFIFYLSLTKYLKFAWNKQLLYRNIQFCLIKHNNNQRTNGPVNAHLMSWPSKAQTIQNNYMKDSGSATIR